MNSISIEKRADCIHSSIIELATTSIHSLHPHHPTVAMGCSSSKQLKGDSFAGIQASSSSSSDRAAAAKGLHQATATASESKHHGKPEKPIKGSQNPIWGCNLNSTRPMEKKDIKPI